MSDDTMSVVITFIIIAILFAWAPLLNLICPPCGRFLERHRQKGGPKRQRVSGAVRH